MNFWKRNYNSSFLFVFFSKLWYDIWQVFGGIYMNKAFSNEEMANYLLILTKIVYDKYSYLGISRDTISKMFEMEMLKSKDNYKGKTNYNVYLKSRVETKILALGIKLFNDADSAVYITNDYINQNYSVIDSINDATKLLKDINDLYHKYEYIPEPDIIGRVIYKNELFQLACQIVTKKYLNIIKSGKLEKVFANNNVNMIIGIYCLINHIEIPESEDLDYADDDFTTDSTKMYLDEVGSIPMLTHEETVTLCERIKSGDINAVKRFTEGNLRLVVKMAKAFFARNRRMPFLDLIEAGNIGLMKAVKKYDINTGFRFSTYATYWIQTEMNREVQNNSRTIRIPISLQEEKIPLYNKAKEQLRQKLGREISPLEVAKAMNISNEQANEYEKIQQEMLSLNYFITAEEDTDMFDLICDDNSLSRMEATNLASDVQRLIKKCNLTSDEEKILALRYGLFDGKTRTLDEIGEIFGLVRESVRRKEANAFYKIRSNYEIDEYAVYMDDPKQAIKRLTKYREVYAEDSRSRYKSNPLDEKEKGYNTVK